MTTTKIYTATPADLSPPVQSESFCVDLVLASDYRELEAKCAALAAECESKKSALAAILEHCPVNDPDIDKAVAAMIAYENLYCEKAPTTDALLAEARAQVWIEGGEPEEFGRYWVRYETDVGPQYCSAKWMEYNFCAGSNTSIHKIWLADHSRSINSLRGVTHYTKLPDSLEGVAQ
ncbi:hypothetical protein ABN12_004232 [Salmonella enterica subsp. enterica serovar Mississippi]|nr:hypothetical protein [Salmonella enterica]ECL8868908.1 hypothetical protein [Salmonella enterica subsp. enterica serovar Ibadan]EGI5663932.1 hypothetical protein [Salmonella enterica subsp. enterica serovar Mississippi]